MKAAIALLSLCSAAMFGSINAKAHDRKLPCGAADWRISCSLVKKTKTDSWDDYWNSVARADIFLCFNNRGGNNEWLARVDHYNKDGGHVSSPLSWFDTVRWGGNELGTGITWKGSGPRFTAKGTSMVGAVSANNDLTRVSYKETIYKGRHRVFREARYKCRSTK